MSGFPRTLYDVPAVTAMIIPSTAPAWVKSMAGNAPSFFFCTGTNDDLVFQAAVNYAQSQLGGVIALYPGNFYFGGVGVLMDSGFQLSLSGPNSGRDHVVINLTATYTGPINLGCTTASGAITVGSKNLPAISTNLSDFSIIDGGALAARPQTTLAGGALDVPTPGTIETIQLTATTGMFAGEMLEIGWTNYEEVIVQSVVDGTHVSVVRGANGTPPQAWNPAAVGGVPVIPGIHGIDFGAPASSVKNVYVISPPGTGVMERAYDRGCVVYVTGAITGAQTVLPVTGPNGIGGTPQAIADGSQLTIAVTPGANAETVTLSNGGVPLPIGSTSMTVVRSSGLTFTAGAQVQKTPTPLFDAFLWDMRVQAGQGDQIRCGTSSYVGNTLTAAMDNAEVHRVFGIGANHYSPTVTHRGRSGIYVEAAAIKFIDAHPYWNQFNAMEIRPSAQDVRITDGEYETSGTGVNTFGGVGINSTGAVRLKIEGALCYQNDTAPIVLQNLPSQAQVTIADVSCYGFPTTSGTGLIISAGSAVFGFIDIRGLTFECTGATGLGAAISVTNFSGVHMNFNAANLSGGAHEVVFNSSSHNKIVDSNIVCGVKETGTSNYNDVQSTSFNLVSVTDGAGGQLVGDTSFTVLANSLTNGRTLYNPATGEQMTLSAGAGTTTLTVIRGVNNSLASAVAANQPLLQIPDITLFNINGNSRMTCRDGILTLQSLSFSCVGTGAQTVYIIPHNMIVAPLLPPVLVYTGSSGAALATTFACKAGPNPATNFQVVFATAPAALTFTFNALLYGYVL